MKYKNKIPTWNETLSTEKQELPDRIRMQNTRKPEHHKSQQHKTNLREDKLNLKLIKKIIAVKKTTLPSLRNLYRKKVKGESEMINTFLPNILTGNITDSVQEQN